jgi:hypothetical protein
MRGVSDPDSKNKKLLPLCNISKECIVTQKLVLDFWYLADPFPQILTRKYDCASVAECEKKRLFCHKILRNGPMIMFVHTYIGFQKSRKAVTISPK